MQITFDQRGPRGGGGGGGGGSGGSKLIDRIGKPPLSERLSDVSTGPGPIRSRTPRSQGRGGGGRGSGGRRSSPKGTPTPKTLEDLDKELEAFMGDGDVAKPSAETTADDVAMT